jgi:hypothetical protein
MWLMLLFIFGIIFGLWYGTASFYACVFWCEMKIIEMFGVVDDL